MKYAIITGDKGFVGRHFARYLRARGWSVLGCDIQDGHDAREFFRTVNTRNNDLVIHCAAIVGGRQVIDGAPLALASNLELDAGLFQWALRNNARRTVYFSSSAAYPVDLQRTSKYGSLCEPDVCFGPRVGLPDQLYGWAKVTGEMLAQRARDEGLKVAVVRPFSGYGEDQDASYPFPAFIDRALNREDPFMVWGDGRQVRDFIHISDIVAAVMTMAENDIEGPVNLCTGRAVSMTQLAEMVTGAAGYHPEISYLTHEPQGVSYRVGCTDRLRKFYEPKVTLEDGIEQALQYRAEQA